MSALLMFLLFVDILMKKLAVTLLHADKLGNANNRFL
jgi:hypothetical protein